MKTKRVRFVFIIVLFSIGWISYTSDNLEDLLLNGPAQKRETQKGLEELLAELEIKLKADPGDYDAHWMYAVLCYFYGDFYAVDRRVKKRYFTLCKDYADKAVHINPRGAAAHYWLGVGMAMWAEYNGILYSLFSADDIVNEMTTVITLNPNFFKGMPWAIRASVYAYAPGVISVGDEQKAKEDIEEALYYGKTYRQTYQLVADIYVYWRDWENAKQIIDTALNLPFNNLMTVEENDCIRKLNEAKQKVNQELAKK
jgi:tetratricopeptide (TPR) repeat protein